PALPPHLFPYTTLFRSSTSTVTSLPARSSKLPLPPSISKPPSPMTPSVSESCPLTKTLPVPRSDFTRIHPSHASWWPVAMPRIRSEEHTSELQSPDHLV